MEMPPPSRAVSVLEATPDLDNTPARLLLTVHQKNSRQRHAWRKECRELGVSYHLVQDLDDTVVFDCVGTYRTLRRLIALPYVNYQ